MNLCAKHYSSPDLAVRPLSRAGLEMQVACQFHSRYVLTNVHFSRVVAWVRCPKAGIVRMWAHTSIGITVVPSGDQRRRALSGEPCQGCATISLAPFNFPPVSPTRQFP